MSLLEYVLEKKVKLQVNLVLTLQSQMNDMKTFPGGFRVSFQ